MKKVVILVDGQNLYYSLQGMSIIEKEVNWTSLFTDIIDKDDELVRTYWFRPAKILDTYYTESNIKSTIIYKKYNSHFTNYKSNGFDSLPAPIQSTVNIETRNVLDWLRTQKVKFSSIEYSYDQLCLDHDNIEMVKTGILKIDPFKQVYIGEKGVDISLAVKMISLSVQKKCDKIILVSGDYDYSEAIRFVKDNMTKINVVKFHKGYPPKNKNMSRDISVLADKVIDVYESDLKNKYKS